MIGISRKFLTICNVIVLLVTTAVFALERLPNEQEQLKKKHSVRLHDKFVFISTLNGQLTAIDPQTGKVKWTLNEEPVIKVPVTVQSGFTFLPDPQDGTLYGLSEGTLKKFPFSIPQLVQASPCKSSEGILYAGSKKDVWFGIDPVTGEKIETLSQDAADKVCPASHETAVFIGRTEYQLTMFDSRNRLKKWNGTFTDYSSHVLPEDTSYSFQHFSSSSDGLMLTVDSTSGDILWEKNFGSPIVAMYMLEGDGLHRLPFTIIGKETLLSLIEASRVNESSMPTVREVLFQNGEGSEQSPKTLHQTLYVGETDFGLYAMPSLVDEKTVTIAPKYLGPPLLEGPTVLAEPVKNPNPPPTRPQITVDVNMAKITHRTVDGEFLLLGYHEAPESVRSDLIVMKQPNLYPIYPSLSYVKSGTKETRGRESRIVYPSHPSYTPENRTLSALVVELWTHKEVAIGVIVGGISIIGMVLWVWVRQKRYTGLIESRSMQTSKNRPFFGRLNSKALGGCDQQIGKIFYKTTEILGRGCEGTVVYRGHFDGRSVAVKRVISDFVNLADREADLLRESDTHSNVIRYYCMESDSQFRYIALELCWATLADYVESEEIRNECPLSQKTILEQATSGLAHLHSMSMVHRDVKPQNVLLSVRNSRGEIRALISDFGLCKKVTCGRNSVSRRSGMAGTDGWIAPEVLQSETSVVRICAVLIGCEKAVLMQECFSVETYAVDVFSLGCVFYYVLTLGCHPFGDNLRRQANILTGEYSMKEISGDAESELSSSLVESMLSVEAGKRPSAEGILKHPFFWTKAKQLAFFQDVSDRVEKEENDSWVLKCLERNGRGVTKGDWRQHICVHLQSDLRRFRTYRGNSVRDLLRAMRNKKHHYRELPEEVRESLGKIPEGFVTYFTSRFPRLLIHSYEAMRCVQEESPFQPYYHSSQTTSASDGAVETT